MDAKNRPSTSVTIGTTTSRIRLFFSAIQNWSSSNRRT
jgi:hypothetical protein